MTGGARHRGFPHTQRDTNRTYTAIAPSENEGVRYIMLVFLAAAFGGVRNGTAQPPTTRVQARADSRLWLEGTSNIRDWTCKAEAMEASFDIETLAAGSAGAKTRNVRAISVKVPIKQLKCGDRHMEAELYKALKATATSSVTAFFERMPDADVDSMRLEVTGDMTLAGVKRSVTVSLIRDRLLDGTHRARGTVPILMTDFGVSPPRPWGGLLRTGNKVLVQFEIFIGATP